MVYIHERTYKSFYFKTFLFYFKKRTPLSFFFLILNLVFWGNIYVYLYFIYNLYLNYFQKVLQFILVLSYLISFGRIYLFCLLYCKCCSVCSFVERTFLLKKINCCFINFIHSSVIVLTCWISLLLYKYTAFHFN